MVYLQIAVFAWIDLLQKEEEMRHLLAAITAVAALVTGSVAHASLSSTPGPYTGPQNPASFVIDFDTHPAPAGSLSGDYAIASTSNSNQAAPLGDASNYLTVPTTNSFGTATLNLASLIPTGDYLSELSYYYGSIDKYNTTSFLDAAGNTVLSFTGGIFPASDGDRTSPDANRTLHLTFTPEQNITSILFDSTSYALETDNFVGTVKSSMVTAAPEPGTWLLMIVGIGAAGLMLRRQQKQLSTSSRFLAT